MDLKTIKPLDPSKESDHKFCFYTRGGLGDSIKKYLGEDTHGDGWEYLIPLKEKYPNSIIKLITFSANSQTPKFHKYHPLIDCIYQGKWRHPQRPCKIVDKVKGDGFKLVKLSSSNELNKKVISDLTPVRQNQFYYSQKDLEFINQITNEGRFVVLHPFAGDLARIVMPIKEYFPLVKQITELGVNVVVVGANWHKPHTIYGSCQLDEKFPFNYPGLINLIDKANPRVVAGLIHKAVCLISVRSYCFSMTKSGKIKSILLVSHPKNKERTYFVPNQTRNNLISPLFGWDPDNIDNNINIIGADYDYNLTRREILKHLKRYI